MMLIIFPNQRDWYKANWAFRQIVSDIDDYCSPTPSISDELEKSQWYGTLRLDELAEPLQSELIQMLALVSEKTLKGEIPGFTADQDGLLQYRQALSELLVLTGHQPDPS